MKSRHDRSLIGVVVYDGVEPIDIGGTVGVISMATRILPNISHVVIAETAGPVRLASGLTILADTDFSHAPACDVIIVAGGPGWRQQVENAQMLNFVRLQQRSHLMSVCTGALILSAAGRLDGRRATTRRNAIGVEREAPLELIARYGHPSDAAVAVVVDDEGIVTGGGVSLAIDATLYVLGKLYGTTARDEIARILEYDRAFVANRDALGHLVSVT